MADYDTKIRIGLDADTSGGEKAEKTLNNIGKAAKKAGVEAKSGLEKMQAGVGKVQGAFGALRNIMTGFGINSMIQTMTAGVARIVDSFKSAELAAKAFADVQSRLAADTALASMASDYAKLSEAIKSANDAQTHQLDLIDLEVAARRKLADARLAAAKEDEIAALDATGGDYADKLAIIEKKYAALAASAQASNAQEDLTLQIQKMRSQADAQEGDADLKDAAGNTIRSRIADLQRKKSRADIAATSLNSGDKTNVLNAVGMTFAQLFSGDWGRMAGATTAAGDATRLAASKESAALAVQIQALTEELRKTTAEANGMREQAYRTRQKADVLSNGREALTLAADTSARTSARETAAAATALGDKRAARAKEVDEATQALDRLQREKQTLEAQIARANARSAANEDTRAAASLSAFNASAAYDEAKRGGNRHEIAAAGDAMSSASRASQEATYQADRIAAQIAATLSALQAKLNAVESAIKTNRSRLKSAKEDVN